ncbi:Barwin-related endoglucanase [Ophiostoma piceae UAMH 11346]|uniref:Barwin-related endoglucanase n=1 Tax=Ophiostoma piceae (strain UAMH 11346) TaxID=1262450 RepID=S3CCX9_OPHP1|nr:Barwin-related endoglucanase [Ophiostoma piceae UAMH 11346]
MKASTILSVVGFTALATAEFEHRQNHTKTHTGSFVHKPTPTTFLTHTAPSAPTGAPNGTHPYGPRAAAESFTGDLTYYNLGLGACGIDSSNQDWTQNVVALNDEQMGTLSNTNPYCGRTITISGNGKTTTGTILDKCMGCVWGDIDVSEKAFTEIFGSLDVGRGKVTWWFN